MAQTSERYNTPNVPRPRTPLWHSSGARNLRRFGRAPMHRHMRVVFKSTMSHRSTGPQ